MFKKTILLPCLVLACELPLLTEARADDLRPVGWWKLDDGTGTVVTDSSGNGITGHFTGHPAWAGGIYGGALRFDGASSVDFGNPRETVITGPLSIACWIKPANLGTVLNAEGHDRAFLARDGAYAFKASGPYLRFTTPGVLDHDATRTLLKVGVWQHVAVTFQPSRAGGCIFYLDGVETDRMTASTLSAGTGPVHIAVNQWPGQFYTGLIDDVRIYNGALTQNVIRRVMLGIEDLSLASNPRPADGSSVEVEAAAVLSWSPGGGMAVSHSVYVGTSPNLTAADLKASRQSGTSYHLSGLQPGVTYYWRVDEVAADGTVYRGNVWHFSVRGKTAYDPTPADGTVAVDLTPILVWRPGSGATRHQVFFGKSFQAVDAGTGAVNKTSTTTPLYVPGTLDIRTTYYWRVDEFDGTRTYKGPVWSFTTKGRPGGLKGQYYSDRSLGALVLTRIDPDINFWWGSSSPDSRMSADNFSVRWTGEVEIPFSDSYTFTTRTDDGVRLYVNNRLAINNWTDHPLTDNWSESIPLVAGQTYPVKMEFYENQEDAVAVLEWQSPSTPRQVVPSDLLSPPYRASNPRPANLSTVSKKAKVILSWSRGEKATEHDIYFGAAQQKVHQANPADATGIYRGRQTDTSYPLPDPLQSGQTYYWRVDEWNIDDTVSEGSVWSFTVSDSVNGDDFETNDFSKFPWRSGGNDWTITASESHSGTYSARAGLIGDDESSTLTLTQDGQAGVITFWCKVSCEGGSDRLEFSIDGIKQGEWSGERDWQAVSFPVNAGVRTFTWTYIKDISSSWGADTAWIDEVLLPL